ncbi:MAG: siderophore-interacting protein, partial [Acidimicrobiales bacterium]|nr:siderophore-interacting protein [Acidimicrobiales bacterium]
MTTADTDGEPGRSSAPDDRDSSGSVGPRRRKAPPPFRRCEVVATKARSPRLRRLTLGGAELVGFAVNEPAASVRVLIPSPGSDELVLPTWTGNEFLFADGRRPVIRTLTPLRADAKQGELDIEVVLHGDGPLARWAANAAIGATAAVSGP